MRREPPRVEIERRRNHQHVRVGRAGQVRQTGLRTHEGAAGVHLMHQVEPLDRRVPRARQADGGGVVDEDVDSAERLDGPGHGLLDVRLVPDVDGDRERTPTCPFDIFRGALNRTRQLRMRRGGLCSDDDLRAIARGPQRDGLPDAAAGAGDEDGFA
jgi:hypothetical protein